MGDRRWRSLYSRRPWGHLGARVRARIQRKWKLQVYNAIIVAQLTYGLNTLQLTPALLARLDAFQMRGLRYILKIEHSFKIKKLGKSRICRN